MNNEIGAITCFAKNCVYHKGNTSCTAGTIEVGNSSACKCGETQCSTSTKMPLAKQEAAAIKFPAYRTLRRPFYPLNSSRQI